MRHRPIPINVEVKREHGVDPLVQLGVWSAAGFKKREVDCDKGAMMPIPGITVVGDSWKAYIAYKQEEPIVSFVQKAVLLSLADFA